MKFFEGVWEAFKDASIDCLKLLPVLFLVYLLVEYLTHKKEEKFVKLLGEKPKTGVLLGALLGCIPQCGFSTVMSDMFNHKMIGIGTLIAGFVATSDEAIPIMLENPNRVLDILILIGIKFVLALFWGYLFYFIYSLISKAEHKKKNLALAGAQQNTEEYLHNHECLIDEKHIHHHEHDKDNHKPCDCCSDNLFLCALKHCLTIALLVFIANFVINLIFVFVGEQVLIDALMVSPILQIIISPLIGLIPNCVSSVVLIELYLNGALIFPALVGGLSAGSGVGLIILFKNKKNIKQNLLILGSLYLIGVTTGLLLSIFF